jgi:hypothetical protein
LTGVFDGRTVIGWTETVRLIIADGIAYTGIGLPADSPRVVIIKQEFVALNSDRIANIRAGDFKTVNNVIYATIAFVSG